MRKKNSGIRKRILEIALPSMGSSLANMLYGVVDLMWIGKLGKEAIASVTLAVSLFNMNFILNDIFGVASVVMLARRWGEGNLREFERIGRQIVVYKFFAGLMILGAMYPLSPYVLSWMGGGKVPIGDALSYYRLRLFFAPFEFMTGTMMTTYRSIGDTKTLFLITFLWNGVNAVFDPIFIFSAGLGVAGSALASGLCYTSAMFMGFYIAKKKWKVDLLKYEKLHLDVLKRVFVLGSPSLLDGINWSVARLITVRIFSGLGVIAAAIFGIYTRVIEMGWMIGFAYEGAITTLVGHKLGRQDMEGAKEVYKEGIFLATITGLALSMIVFSLAYPITRIFTSDPDLIVSSVRFLRLTSFGFVFMLMLNAFYGVLVGGGRTIDTFYVGISANWGFRIPGLLVASKFFPSQMLYGVIYALSIGFGAFMGYIIVRKGRWMLTDV